VDSSSAGVGGGGNQGRQEERRAMAGDRRNIECRSEKINGAGSLVGCATCCTRRSIH